MRRYSSEEVNELHAETAAVTEALAKGVSAAVNAARAEAEVEMASTLSELREIARAEAAAVAAEAEAEKLKAVEAGRAGLPGAPPSTGRCEQALGGAPRQGAAGAARQDHRPAHPLPPPRGLLVPRI